MKKFTFFWLTGKREILEGNSPEDALNQAGYGQGAVRALDFFAKGDCQDYIWKPSKHTWDWTPECKAKALQDLPSSEDILSGNVKI